MQGYACGFLFSPDRSRVVLIRKNRPAWQVGKLNGVGGKIEPGENPLDAMRREFREEAGVDVPDWEQVLTLTGADWQGHFFRSFGALEGVRSITDEQLEIHGIDALPANVIPNLKWMIPLMLDEEPISRQYFVQLSNHPIPGSINPRSPISP